MANETRVITVNRGTSQQWGNQVRPLESGELGYATNTKELKIGDGVKPWAETPAYYHKDMGHLLPAGTLGHGQGAMWNENQQKWVPRPNLAEVHYYVNPAGEDHPKAGYDATHPLRTISYALSRAQSILHYPPRIKLADGVYPEVLRQSQSYTLIGNVDNPSAVVIGYGPTSGTTVLTAHRQATVSIMGVTFRPTLTMELSTNLIWAATDSALHLSTVKIDTTALTISDTNCHTVVAGALSRVALGDVVLVGNTSTVLYAHGGWIYVANLVCQGNMTINSSFVNVVLNGFVAFFGGAVVITGTLSGGKRYLAGGNGDIAASTSIPVSNLEPGIAALGGRVN